MITVDEVRGADKTDVRLANGKFCPPRIVVGIGTQEWNFGYLGDDVWRLMGISTYGNYSMAVDVGDVECSLRRDASGVVVGGPMAYLLDELLFAAELRAVR